MNDVVWVQEVESWPLWRAYINEQRVLYVRQHRNGPNKGKWFMRWKAAAYKSGHGPQMTMDCETLEQAQAFAFLMDKPNE